ncbi:MAG TPA: amidohydrolase family protein [Candidatus Acidoferrales bacterium]|nr:amidohydrolase family protein [Candidatus Acidoferrales bacterium]
MKSKALVAFAVCSILALGLAPREIRSQEAAKPSDSAKKDDAKATLPLKPERKIEISTDEGTWMSLDVSPDGRTIVFELLGHLYTMPVEGGQAKPLATGLPFDSQPRYSPDGKLIALISDRDGGENLWIMKSDGTDPKKLSHMDDGELASPVWTPDGQYVLVSQMTWSQRTYELWMYHVQGGTGVQVTKSRTTTGPATPTTPRLNALGAVFSPDGRYIYYERRAGGFAYNAMFPLWQIARHDRVTGDDDTLTQVHGSAIRPLISPDGGKLIYGTRYETKTGLRLRDLNTGEDHWLKYPIQKDDQESRFTRDLLPGYAFLPGGKEIIMAWDGKFHRLNIESGADAVIPFTAQISEDLGPDLHIKNKIDEGPVRARIIQDVSQSPDGKRILFSALTHLYSMDLPDGPCRDACSGSPRRITRGNSREFQPTWSPDGRWIAYVSWENGQGQIWKIAADGSGEPQQLTRMAAFYSDLTWSPDGDRIVALRASAHDRLVEPEDFGELVGSDVIWISSGGGQTHLISPARGVGRPHFTHEKDRVYFYSREGLLSMRYDGTDRRTHLKVTGTGLYTSEGPAPADDVIASPDAHWVLAHVMNQLYVAAMPEVGGEAPTVNVNSSIVPIKKITDVGADYFSWADDGKTITWAVGSSYFRVPLSSITFEPAKKAEDADKSAEPSGSSGEKGSGADAAKSSSGNQGDKSKVAEKPPQKNPQQQEYRAPVEATRKIPRGTLLLRGATIITMKGDEVIKDADLVVKDNRIVSVGKRGAVPTGAQVIDVRGMTISPGFVDTHAHWFEIRRGVLDLQNWDFMINLAYGVTTGCDVQTSTNDMFAYQDLVDAGEILGFRAFNTGPGVFSDNAFKSLDEVKGVLDRYKNYYRTNYIKSYIVGNRKQREWMVMASKQLGLMPTTEGGLDFKLDMTHAIDGMAGNEHTLAMLPLSKDVVELFAKSGVSYTPTFIVAYGSPWAENYFFENTEVHDNPKLAHFMPENVLDAKTQRRPEWFRKDEYSFPQLAAQAVKIIRAGGHVGIGSHGEMQGIGYHWEMWALSMGGATPMEVLRAATLHGATMLGLDQDLGSIEPGKLADFVIFEKNPLEDIHNTNTIHYVMKNGELFEGDTLNQVYPEKKPLPPMWWWTTDKVISAETTTH